MISPTLVLMLASCFFLNPPATGMWAYADLQPSNGIEARNATCGVREVSMLSSTVFQLVTDGLTDEQLKQYRRLKSKLEREYAGAIDQDRAKLVLELQKIGSAKQRRLIRQSWIRMDWNTIHFLDITDLPSGNALMKIEDVVTGEYVAVLSEGKGKATKTTELIDELLEPDKQSQATSEIITELDALGKERRLRVEVNGVVIVIDQEDENAVNQLDASFSLLWKHLPKGIAKKRIEMAIPVFWRAMADKTIFSNLGLKWPLDPRKTPYDLCLSGTFKADYAVVISSAWRDRPSRSSNSSSRSRQCRFPIRILALNS